MSRFTNKVAIVTGGGGGIGRATCKRLSSEGAAIVAYDLKSDAAAETVAEIVNAGGKAIGIGGDILSELDIQCATDAALKAFGTIDVLVNNAAFTIKPRLDDVSPEDWDREVDITLKGAYLVTRAILPAMVKQGRGAIVNIGSVNGLKYFGNPAYSAAKAGLISLTQSVAIEYGRHGVRANMVSPGTIQTNAPAWVARQKKDPKIFDKLARWYPVGRVGKPEDIAAAIAFLASDEAAFITGTNLVVDGGVTAGMGVMTDEIMVEQDDAKQK
ncbi:MAG TPA: glucose 1-dehydrogenase [Magnetospirillaceae bacterium]|jgi:NAD(P)-dependent dehydrogenase (short-subunit alcohol dehydrogenase family)